MKKLSFLFLVTAFMLCACSGSVDAHTVSRQSLKAHTEYLTQDIGVREVGTKGEQLAAEYVYSQLEKCGFPSQEGTLFLQSFTAAGNESENVVAIKPAVKSDKIIIVGAHHDSVPTSAGAKDNAAGTAAFLEIARVLACQNEVLAEIRFISFGSEENGFHGSAHYVSTLSQDEIDNIVGVFNLDISAASKGDGFIPVCTTLGGRAAGGYKEGDGFEAVDNAISLSIEQAYINLGYFKKSDEGQGYKRAFHYGESDHISFHKAGIDSANVCWRKLENGRATLPPEYHKMTDTPDKIDFSTTELTANAIIEGVKILDRQ